MVIHINSLDMCITPIFHSASHGCVALPVEHGLEVSSHPWSRFCATGHRSPPPPPVRHRATHWHRRVLLQSILVEYDKQVRRAHSRELANLCDAESSWVIAKLHHLMVTGKPSK